MLAISHEEEEAAGKTGGRRKANTFDVEAWALGDSKSSLRISERTELLPHSSVRPSAVLSEPPNRGLPLSSLAEIDYPPLVTWSLPPVPVSRFRPLPSRSVVNGSPSELSYSIAIASRVSSP